MIREASIHQRNDVMWIRAMSATEHMLWIADGPATVLFVESDASEKGEAVLAALARSRRVPHPTSWDRPSLLLRASGARSWRAFEKNTKYVSIELDTKISIIPTQHRKKGDGYLHMPEKTIWLPSTATPAELGDAIDRGLALCD